QRLPGGDQLLPGEHRLPDGAARGGLDRQPRPDAGGQGGQGGQGGPAAEGFRRGRPHPAVVAGQVGRGAQQDHVLAAGVFALHRAGPEDVRQGLAGAAQGPAVQHHRQGLGGADQAGAQGGQVPFQGLDLPDAGRQAGGPVPRQGRGAQVQGLQNQVGGAGGAEQAHGP